jgi:Asp-tRNA(Asn)/Glu-tRNA(Gln) amidotransferase A subunit family amidase
MSGQNKSLLGLIWDVQAGHTPPEAAVAAALARADAVEPWLRAFRHLARPAATGRSGPLLGVAVGVKDIIATAGMPTEYGSPVFAGHVPETDAWIVAKIKEFGGTVLGKTVTTEFAWREPGPTVNPWNPAHTPGGSSSGSAAAVAAGIVPLALGTQTVGSVVRPAAYNGVVGFKPSFGTIPRDGVHPLAGSLDHVGFFTRNAADAAAAFALLIDGRPDVVTGQGAWAGYFAPVAAPRLAVLRSLWDRVEAVQRDNFEAQLAALRAAGAALTEIEPPDDALLIVESCNLVLAYEAARIYGELVETCPAQTSARLKSLVTAGRSVGEARYQEALAAQARLRARMGAWLDGCDAVVSVPAAGAAPRGLDETGDASFCAPWTLFGVPAVTIPSGWTAAGLPLGLQLAAPFGRDLPLLRIAAWAEQAVAFQDRAIGGA